MPSLEFKGKQHIYAHHLMVPYRPLRPVPSKSVHSTNVPQLGGGGTAVESSVPDGNLIIHGDNLHALKALLPRYAGRVKCIYIDPPYNTGNEDWVYNDNVNSPLMRQWLSNNKPVDGEDLQRHDKWLCMMWPRLQLLRELLSDDGVIFISIDDNEQHHLRMLMDEVFGAENFVASVAVVTNLAGSSDQFGFAGAHEHCLAYAGNRDEVTLGLFQVDEDALSKWQQDEIGYYRPELLQRGSLTYSESLDYPIFVDAQNAIQVTEDDMEPPNGGPFSAVYPSVGEGNRKSIWRWSKARILKNPNDVFVRRRRDGNIGVYSKQRPRLGDIPTVKPKSVFHKAEYSTRAGGQTLSEILPDANRRLAYPKATALISDLLRVGTTGPNDIVLDSFAGSGTTAHAVLTLNKEDGGNRKFILVECEGYADTITAERVRRVINGVPGTKDKSLRDGLGGEFTYCELGEPISIEGMLNGELPPYSDIASMAIHNATGSSPDTLPNEYGGDLGFVYESEKTRYHLLYRPDIDWLQGEEGALNSEKAKRISDAAMKAGKDAIVFAPARYMSQRDLTQLGITFCQLPYELTTPRLKAVQS